MEVLEFKFRNEYYQVDEKGRIKANGLSDFSENWLFLGGMHHHWCNHVSRPFKMVWGNPKLLENCYGVDRDHGTMRVWSGMFNGRMPKITNVHKRNI